MKSEYHGLNVVVVLFVKNEEINKKKQKQLLPGKGNSMAGTTDAWFRMQMLYRLGYCSTRLYRRSFSKFIH